VVVAVLLALTVPLAISLRDRARAEKKTEVLTSALTIASGFDSETLRAGPALDRKIQRYAEQVDGGRVIALDRDGTVLADSDGEAVGDNFLTPLRPELHDHALFAAAPSANAEIRFSTKLQTDLMVAAAPVVDPELIGAVRISMPIQAVNDAVRRTTIGLVSIVGGVGLVIGLVIAFVVSGSLARPLTRLAALAPATSRLERTTSREPTRSRSWPDRSTTWPAAWNAPCRRNASSWRTRPISSALRSPG
jgi:sensor histidine kinase regulating citrate/malate metabolism